MRLSQFDYELPEEKIAQEPAEPRDSSKLMVVDRSSKKIQNKIFRELLELLSGNDVLVFNQTKVMPVRLFGNKNTGGKVELLLVKQTETDTWEAITRPALKEGQEVQLGGMMATCIKKDEETVHMKFNYSGDYLKSRIYELGKTPLPPYIHSEKSERDLRKLYQTVYAKDEGSAAAPTAGFHFTRELIEAIKAKGVEIEFVTLHVGLGTFKPVKSDDIEEHKMHAERFQLSEETAKKLNEAKEAGKRIIAVGTTAMRVLETCSDERGHLSPLTGETEIFIYPPYEFKFVDALITNFHLPKSTLLMLISALVSKPNSKEQFVDFETSLAGIAYKKAIEDDYRFFSFGDAMLIA